MTSTFYHNNIIIHWHRLSAYVNLPLNEFRIDNS